MADPVVDREKLSRLREAAGLSVQEAAKAAGVTRQQWYNVEDGSTTNVGVETLDAMARVFKKRAKDLLK